MSVLSSFEGKIEGAVDGAAGAVFSGPLQPAQIAKKAEKHMKREKLVGSGRQYAPTLYNVLVSEFDDKRLFGFYPTMASEVEIYLYARGTESGLEFDTRPLVRFIVDKKLKKGRFDIIAEVVAAPIIKKLRAEELEYYGLAPQGSAAQGAQAAQGSPLQAQQAMQAAQAAQPGAQQALAQAAQGAQPISARFAGLNVPATLDDITQHERQQLPGVGQGAAKGGLMLPSLDAGAGAQQAAAGGVPALASLAPLQAQPLPAQAPLPAPSALSPLPLARPGTAAQTHNPAPEPDAAQAAALGNATLFNLSEQRQYRLEQRKLTLGRGRENAIVLSDANASRIHARLTQDAIGTWKITDLGSTNGTMLNGRPVSTAVLRNGDEIAIGTTVLRFTNG